MDYMDMLAKLGIGNAHPGGYAGTLRLITHFGFGHGQSVLEVGCGTGRTACRLAALGCCVTAVDSHPVMLEKAEKRAPAEGARVCWLRGEAERLPCPDNSFDRVLVESVTVFADAGKAVSEYLRVLKPGGLLLDRELLAAGPLPGELAAELAGSYGIAHLRTAEEWRRLLEETGFGETGIWDHRSMTPQLWEDVVMFPDAHQFADRDLGRFPSLWETARRYEEQMNANQALLGHGAIIGRKRQAVG